MIQKHLKLILNKKKIKQIAFCPHCQTVYCEGLLALFIPIHYFIETWVSMVGKEVYYFSWFFKF